MFTRLMTSRRFAPLFWCQLCSALNDNFLKNALAMLILFGLGGSGAAGGESAALLITLSGIVFIAPFFIFSALGGELADRYDKAIVARCIRLAEMPVAGLAAIGFFWQSVPILFVTLGLFGIISALFGPLKYGLLPEKLETAELSAGNALVEGATFLAILIGTIAGGVAVAEAKGAEFVVAVIGLLALASWLLAHAIPVSGPAAPDLAITANPWTSTLALLRETRTDKRLWSGAHIVSWFWLVGFVALSLLPPLVKGIFGGSEGVVTTCLAVFTVGIAIGSVVAAQASHGRPNLSLVPLGRDWHGRLLACRGVGGVDRRAGAEAVVAGSADRVGPGHGAAGEPVRPGDRRGAVRGTVVCGRAGLGAGRPARACDRRGQRAQCRLHGRGGRRRGGAASGRRRSAGAVCRARAAQPRGRGSGSKGLGPRGSARCRRRHACGGPESR